MAVIASNAQNRLPQLTRHTFRPLDLAYLYALRIEHAHTVYSLKAVGKRIKNDLHKVFGYEDWLRDLYGSKMHSLTEIPIDPATYVKKEYLKCLNISSPTSV